jgi:hypothetical protein
MWNSEAAFELGFIDWAIEWADRGIWEAPLFFEPKGLRAHIAYQMQDWSTCYKFAIQILTHTRAEFILVRPEYWDWVMYDLIAISAYKMGDKNQAIHFGKLAVEGNPGEDRVRKNLEIYEQGL